MATEFIPGVDDRSYILAEPHHGGIEISVGDSTNGPAVSVVLDNAAVQKLLAKINEIRDADAPARVWARAEADGTTSIHSDEIE